MKELLKIIINRFLRVQLHRVYKKIKCLFLKECDENELKRSAIFFSPHQDDETLGCGGTIIRKKRMGAEVKIVFMTDGCNSHPHLITKNVYGGNPKPKKEGNYI